MVDELRRGPSGPDAVIGSDDVLNQSSVVGDTLTDALDTLLATPGTPGPPGPTGATGATGPTGATGATGATGSVDYSTQFELVDDFDFLGNDVGSIATTEHAFFTGSRVWSVAATAVGAARQLAGVDNHPGILQLTTGGTFVNSSVAIMGGGVGFNAGSANVLSTILYQNITSVTWIVRFPSNANSLMYLSMLNVLPTITNSMEFLFDTLSSADLQLITRVAGVTVVETVPMPTANTWVRYEIRCTPTQIQFFVDGVQVGTTRTTVPTGVALTPYVQVATRIAGTAKSIDLDLFWLRGAVAR